MNLAGTPHPIWDSRRLWSLADMINFYLYNFMLGQQFLRQAVQTATEGVALRQYEIVGAAGHERISREVRDAIKCCVEALSLYEAGNTAIEIENMLGSYPVQKYNWRELHTLLARMQDQIEREVQAECFFHYMREDARLVHMAEKEWSEIIAAFPSVKPEIIAGIDCFAIGHNTACVFHMMRTAEFGLRMIARERGLKRVGRNKPIEWGMWRDIFQAIEGKLRGIRNAAAGPKREAALRFYEGAMSDLHALQTNYRDPTMHFRESYDRGQAHSAMFRVKSLIGNLATKLREDRVRKIRWGL